MKRSFLTAAAKMRNPGLSAGILLLLLLILFPPAARPQEAETAAVQLGEKIYTFEIAATAEARRTGLMHRDRLDPESGMLFVFPRQRQLHFYMKNTRIPLDIAFIDKDRRIVDIQQMKPLDETVIHSRYKAKYALEVNRGFFSRIGIEPGDRIYFLDPPPPAR
jgi:uncharacterized membrane protein (UPF0127 family)